MPERDSYSQGTPSWVDLATTDDDGAVAFYSALFGWEDVPNPAGPGMTYHMMKLRGRDAGAIFKQDPDDAAQGIPPHWNTYITVADVDAVTARVPAAGGQVLAKPFDVTDAGRMAVVQDPTGAVVSFWQAGANCGAEIVNEPGALCWSELQTRDLDRAGSFLTEVLGVEVQCQEEPMVYAMIKVSGADVGGIMPISDEMGDMPPSWSVYFATADCDATVAKVKKLGGAVHRAPWDLMVGRIAVVADPQGAVFQVIQMN
ncbi:MAG: VOC family protein [Acidobacteriota bacterium]|nr:VOC family protein [Acidobacteriota bacterium]